MNEPTTKEEALKLLNQFQSKFSITKRDINESFNKNIEDNNSSTPNTKIRLITVDEAVLKIIIPWNKDKLWSNKIENYPAAGKTEKGYWIYYNYWWAGHVIDKLQNFVIRTTRNTGGQSGFLSEYSYTRIGGCGPAMIYQDNVNNWFDVRVYDENNRHYSRDGSLDSRDYTSQWKNSINANTYSGFLPVIIV